MEILSVTLKNFKSHSDRHFVFQPGTNAICGENGAGKTSILEAIAWALFNYRGAYKNEDLIRNGAGSAQVSVAFVSNRDGRTYEVQRCTTKGYTLYDPQLGTRLDYKHIEDEVIPWLRQQFGVAPGTDLGRLFANTIGVPQGTFTADFLQPPEKRKPIFDAILKVEEYRQANQQLLSLEKYGKAEVENLERAIAQYDDTLSEQEALQQQRQGLHQEITEAQTTLEHLQTQLADLQTEKNQLAAQKEQVQQLTVQMQQITVQVQGQRQTNALLLQSVQRAKQAVQTCQANRNSYLAFLHAEAALKQLDQQVKQRQIVLKQREQQQQALASQHTKLTRLSLQLERVSHATAEIEQLQPLIEQQTALEQQQAAVVEQLNQLQAFKLEQQNLSRQLHKLEAEQTRLGAEIEQLQSLAASVNQIATLEQTRDRLQEQLSRVEAAKQFEADLRQLVTQGEAQRDRHQTDAEAALAVLRQVQQSMPLLATASVESALTAIQAGVTLNTDLLNALWRILADLSEQLSVPKLQQQLWQVKTKLEAAYQQRADLATLDGKRAQQAQVKTDISQMLQQLNQTRSHLATEPDWKARRSQLMADLAQLSDPRNRCRLLTQELQQQAQLQAAYQQAQQAHQALQHALIEIEQQLQPFADLDEQLEQHKQQQQQQQPAYLTYLQHQKEANQLPKLEADLQTAIAQLQQLEAEQTAVQAAHQQAAQAYDPQRWQQVEATHSEVRSRADQIAGGLPQQRKLLMQIDSQLATLQAIADKRNQAAADLKRKEKVRKFITFARRVYKEAGPRITERYVQTISHEADRLFRELLNRPNVALEWTRDYDILIQEGAHTRRLINLSGGEQMCAALAVRLALLRILADIDIAFFDEPTTNMDRPRRESLADAIANIKTFRQLFVISHDDTFEKVTENVILVEREL
jgi:exonuclease SbcC